MPNILCPYAPSLSQQEPFPAAPTHLPSPIALAQPPRFSRSRSSSHIISSFHARCQDSSLKVGAHCRSTWEQIIAKIHTHPQTERPALYIPVSVIESHMGVPIRPHIPLSTHLWSIHSRSWTEIVFSLYGGLDLF